MSKRNLLNLILFIFIIALVSFIVFEPGKHKPLAPTVLTTLSADDVQHIKIIRNSANSKKQTIIFKKSSAGWIMSKPYQTSANTFRIDSILKLLSTVSFSQNHLSKLEPTKFGLTQPAASIIFNNQTTLVFGHNKSLKHHRYVKINSTLHMINDSFYYQLIAKAESYINHKVLPEKSKIIKLHLPEIKLQQKNGKWNITPKADNLSADAANQLISEWQLSQGYDINKINASPASNADIIIDLASNKTIRFKIEKGKNKFNLVNIDTGIRYILSTDRKNKLLNLSNPEQTE
jgi:hypothetical protein